MTGALRRGPAYDRWLVMRAQGPWLRITSPSRTQPGVRRLANAASRLGRWAVALAEAPWSAALVFAIAVAVWWLEALVIPLGPGRDVGTYLGAYVELFQSDPIDLGYVLGRTPIASLVSGGLLDFAGGALAEPAISLLYAGAVTAWFLAARRFGGAAALLATAVVLIYPGYAILFHELSSDVVFAAAFAGWSWLAVRVLVAPSVGGFALLGLGVGILALVRPVNQALLVLAVVPLALAMPWRLRLVSAAAYVVPAVALVGAWTLHNGLRYDNYTLARGGNAAVPFFRAFTSDRIVRPDNGPASREVAQAVREDLLPNEPYRSYGISLQEFFTEASPRMQEDLLFLSDRRWGFDSNHEKLRAVGIEAVRTHPGTYARGVSSTVWGLLTRALFRPLGGQSASDTETATSRPTAGEGLPEPTEGEPIPAPHQGGVATRDGSIRTVWTSPTEHHLVFDHPGDERRYRELHRRIGELQSNLPDRSGQAQLALRLNQASRWHIPPLFWLLLGAAAVGWRKPARALALVVPTVAALAVIASTALAIPTVPHYSVPVAPAFVLLAAGALFGPRRARTA